MGSPPAMYQNVLLPAAALGWNDNNKASALAALPSQGLSDSMIIEQHRRPTNHRAAVCHRIKILFSFRT